VPKFKTLIQLLNFSARKPGVKNPDTLPQARCVGQAESGRGEFSSKSWE
jgi:hypothetical protein